MPAMQKRKGKTGELELAKKLTEKLGTKVTRNLGQTRDGGHDLNLDGWALEVKRANIPRIKEWWEQTIKQAEETNRKPVLAYRVNFGKWKFMVRLQDINEEMSGQGDYMTAEVDIDGFCIIAREAIRGMTQ